MTLATDWTSTDVTGWFASEKLNGCRAYWDGRTFWTRGGISVDAPAWFTKGLPKIHLDGEIHAGRGVGFGNQNTAYKSAMTAVRHGRKWFDESIRFTAFDAPHAAGNWQQRMAEAEQAVSRCQFATAINFWRVKTFGADIVNFMLKIRPLHGEGICLRNPETTTYEMGRTQNLLRFKFVE